MVIGMVTDLCAAGSCDIGIVAVGEAHGQSLLVAACCFWIAALLTAESHCVYFTL